MRSTPYILFTAMQMSPKSFLLFQLSVCRTFVCLDVSQPVSQPAADSSPWCFEQLCRAASIRGASDTGAAAAAAGGGLAPPSSGVASRRMLSRLSRDDIALLARHLVRTKRAVEEQGLLKVLARGVGGGGVGGQGGGRAAAAAEASSMEISETEKDLLRLRCTGEEFHSRLCRLNDCLWESLFGGRTCNEYRPKRSSDCLITACVRPLFFVANASLKRGEAARCTFRPRGRSQGSGGRVRVRVRVTVRVGLGWVSMSMSSKKYANRLALIRCRCVLQIGIPDYLWSRVLCS